MTYDPFKRGRYPVGVKTIELEAGKQVVAVEIWYPATEGHRGEDRDRNRMDGYTVAPGFPVQFQNAVRDAQPVTGRFPLVINPHAAVGHRRDASPVCTHLASHGYVVASPEFAGDTSADLVHDAAAADAEKRSVPMPQNLNNRERIAVATIAAFVNCAVDGFSDRVDALSIGAVGVSLGGWTTLRMLSLDRHMKAVLLAVPSWGTTGPFEATKMQHTRVRLEDWGRDVPVFLLAG